MTITRRTLAASITDGDLTSFVEPQGRERTPWLLAFLCLLIPLLRAYTVPRNLVYSPARLISIGLLAFVVLAFIVRPRTKRIQTVKPGAIVILVYFLLQLTVYVAEASKTDRTIVGPGKILPFTLLLATVGIALYTTTRVATTRQRTLLLGVLAVGLTFACTV